ncbi:MAG: hypothetical protein HYY34_02785 [Chloroflexi bacterium]|nr:hypothetical protein [Chloroflexota bacterium]
MGRSEAEAALLIALRPASQSVSAISSLLREVQAALRGAARATPECAHLFESDQSPVLVVRFADAGDGVTIGFTFVDPSTRSPLLESSAAVVRRFIRAMEEVLKSRPQRTLWGPPAVTGRRRPADGERDSVAERAAVVLTELGRFPAVTISGGGRRIQIEGETAEIL